MDSSQRKLYSDDHSTELTNESLAASIISKRHFRDDLFIQRFPTDWTLPSSVSLFRDITWTEMKKFYHWGFCKGSVIHSTITWIYIRPDIATSINSDLVGGIIGLLAKGTLNIHFFVVKLKAINYFLSKASNLITRPLSDDEESSDDNNIDNSPDKINIKRKRFSSLIDDEAIEEK